MLSTVFRYYFKAYFKAIVLRLAAQALHRYPDGALISFALGIPAGIPLDVDMERRLELFVPGEPFAEDPRVDRLQRLRHRPDAPEFRSEERRVRKEWRL